MEIEQNDSEQMPSLEQSTAVQDIHNQQGNRFAAPLNDSGNVNANAHSQNADAMINAIMTQHDAEKTDLKVKCKPNMRIPPHAFCI